MQKWEYLIRSLNMAGRSWSQKQMKAQRQKLQDELNELGVNGWETVSFSPIDKGGEKWLLMLKRPKS